MERLLHHVLGDTCATSYGVLLVTVFSIAARFTLGVIALRKARPEHVADVTKALCSRWRQR